jgi:hypothetical protein
MEQNKTSGNEIVPGNKLHIISLTIESKAGVDALHEPGYELIYTHAGCGTIWRHELVDCKALDYREVLEIAIDKAACGCIVHLLPV